jgi:hypothetical protein
MSLAIESVVEYNINRKMSKLKDPQIMLGSIIEKEETRLKRGTKQRDEEGETVTQRIEKR